MKAIIMSINPKWVAKILNGEKTIEIRKKFPKDYRGWVYIYCTKDHNNGLHWNTKKWVCVKNDTDVLKEICFNGKAVARFWCDKVDVFHILPTERIIPFNRNVEPLLKNICLTKEEIMAYGNGDDYYAHLIHITKLEIFDKPKEISEFSHKNCRNCIANDGSCYLKNECLGLPLTRVPQSWCYVEI